jgi:hypothetical protein
MTDSETPIEDIAVPPTPERVAARAIVLAAITCRAMIERDAGKSDAEQLRTSVSDWVNRLGVSSELEQSESDLLSTPLGGLDRGAVINASWCSEGMTVLAWVLGCAPLPAYYTQCEPSNVAHAMGFLRERSDTPLRQPQLRDSNEIVRWEETYLTLHWRLRQFISEPDPIDFAGYVSSCKWGPLRLDELELCEGDLAINGVRIDRLDEATCRTTLSIVQERHRAFNWLVGFESVYSQVTTDS